MTATETKLSVKLDITPAQNKFLKSSKRYVIFRGGVGSGKTRVLVYKAILNAIHGRKQVLVANTYTQLRDVILATFIEVLPIFNLEFGRDVIINKADMDILIYGTIIHLRSAEQEDRLRGINCSDVLIDEGRNLRDDHILMILIGRIRQVSNAQVFICSSPRGKDWMYELTQKFPEDCEVIIQRTDDNPFLPQSYIEDLRSKYTSQFAAQELDAEIIEMSAGVLRHSWFREIEPFKPDRGVRAWDLAVSIKTSSDYAAGALMCMREGKVCITDILRGKYEYPMLKSKIVGTALHDGRPIVVAIEHVGTQLGFIQDLQHEPALRPYTIRAIRPQADKLARCAAWSSRAEQGGILVCKGPWNKAFYDECDAFSADMSHAHDDQIDAVSIGYSVLTEPMGSAAKVRLY